eukprot:4301221-Amphidinium_carterae.1
MSWAELQALLGNDSAKGPPTSRSPVPSKKDRYCPKCKENNWGTRSWCRGCSFSRYPTTPPGH